MHISSSYAKILGQELFRTWEFPRSGSKAKDGEKRKKKERAKVGDNNGQATHGARKHAWHTQATWASFTEGWTKKRHIAVGTPPKNSSIITSGQYRGHDCIS